MHEDNKIMQNELASKMVLPINAVCKDFPLFTHKYL